MAYGFHNPALQAAYNWFMLPSRLAALRGRVPRQGARILDVGCGNHSPLITKRYLPGCEYHGVDQGRWNRDAADDACIDRFFAADLDAPEALAAVPDDHYDAVLCSHVLEHLTHPREAVAQLAAKVRPGGLLYLETPAARSTRLPRAAGGWCGVRGCLNFRDDETHRELVDLGAIRAALEARGFAVLRQGPARLWRRVWLLPLYVAAVLPAKGFVPASLLWDVTGFATGLLTVRKRE